MVNTRSSLISCIIQQAFSNKPVQMHVTASEFELGLFSPLNLDCFLKPHLHVSYGGIAISIGDLEKRPLTDSLTAIAGTKSAKWLDLQV